MPFSIVDGLNELADHWRDSAWVITVKTEHLNLPKVTHLKVSDALLPAESAVLVGLVPLSKLNVFGLSECGDAVVELAIHNLESVIVFCIFVFVVVEEYDAPLFPGTTLGVWL